ncbi:GlxA family transcriptional regulator [Stenotrophomonas indicatrix]|uniref:GlxA family transcriptional regulator n=1 Tax=Stenotrophomonas indicatrix TaxID=2045451 RepID=UPI0008B92C8B|nr:helix-turn-helix domain-containing protein [Stenotrophomonas indicatrix]SET45736.1 Transcriptional regulator GlxA family, contains an amidase domain and an AraC-type DNA-binding HTH domain [Stenotrophomonas indicatrix]
MDTPEFVIAVLDGTLAASVGATLDVLDFANRSAERLGRPALRWRVVGSRRHLRLSNGMTLRADPLSSIGDGDPGVLVIPSLGLDGMLDVNGHEPCGLDARYTDGIALRRLAMVDAQQLARLARQFHERGGRTYASCSGVLVLGEAGLLDGRRITSHWALSSLLRRRFPRARLDPACMVVEDGRLTTAGAAMAQMDLMLHLVRQYAGREVAEAVMRFLLVDSRSTQARYMAWQGADHDDDTVRRFESLIETSLPHPLGMEEAAQRLHLTTRTLARRVHRVTGSSPRVLVQAVRMRMAQRLLEMTDLSIDDVAERVGYANATSLRKLTLKMTRLTPALLRRQL